MSDTFDGANEIFFACAFIEKDAVDQIEAHLLKTLKQGGRVTGYCGSDFYLTEPLALQKLFNLQTSYDNCKFYLFDASASTFHPKIYMGRHGQEMRCLIGSSNLTQGGLWNNIEASLAIIVKQSDPLAQQLLEYLFQLQSNKRCRAFNSLGMISYKDKYDAAKKIEQTFKKLQAGEQKAKVDVNDIDHYINEWRLDATSQNDLRKRKVDYKKAVKELNEICAINPSKMSPAEEERFRKCFRNLITSVDGDHLWRSGSLYRKGLQALDYPAKTIRMFRAIKVIIGRTPEQAFDVAIAAAQDIPGIGPNIVTEALTTFNPKMYAILNGNTLASLRYLSLPAPSSINKRSFKGKSYNGLVLILTEIKNRMKVGNYLEVDSFLNFLYWRYEKGYVL